MIFFWKLFMLSSNMKLQTKKKKCAGVSGGTASGKTTVCDMIIQQLHDHRVVLVNQVCYLFIYFFKFILLFSLNVFVFWFDCYCACCRIRSIVVWHLKSLNVFTSTTLTILVINNCDWILNFIFFLLLFFSLIVTVSLVFLHCQNIFTLHSIFYFMLLFF